MPETTALHAGAAQADGRQVRADGGDPDADRPDDCNCPHADHDLPCWPCYREEWSHPNPVTCRFRHTHLNK